MICCLDPLSSLFFASGRFWHSQISPLSRAMQTFLSLPVLFYRLCLPNVPSFPPLFLGEIFIQRPKPFLFSFYDRNLEKDPNNRIFSTFFLESFVGKEKKRKILPSSQQQSDRPRGEKGENPSFLLCDSKLEKVREIG